MTRIDKILAGLAASLLLIMCLSAIDLPVKPSSITEIVEGEHYSSLPPLDGADADVLMFFWYGCPHCLKTYESMQRDGFFAKAEAGKISIRKIPVSINEQWTLHAKLYYALDMYGLSEEGHLFTMRLIQSSRANSLGALERVIDKVIENEKKLNQKFSATTKQVLSRMDSRRVQQKLAIDHGLFLGAKLSGVPSVVVLGKYLVTLGSGIGYSDLPVVVLKLAMEKK